MQYFFFLLMQIDSFQNVSIRKYRSVLLALLKAYTTQLPNSTLMQSYVFCFMFELILQFWYTKIMDMRSECTLRIKINKDTITYLESGD